MHMETQKTSSNRASFDDANLYFRIHEIDLANNINVLYFDRDWDLKECSLMQIMTTPEILCQFRSVDTQNLIKLYRVYFM